MSTDGRAYVAGERARARRETSRAWFKRAEAGTCSCVRACWGVLLGAPPPPTPAAPMGGGRAACRREGARRGRKGARSASRPGPHHPPHTRAPGAGAWSVGARCTPWRVQRARSGGGAAGGAGQRSGLSTDASRGRPGKPHTRTRPARVAPTSQNLAPIWFPHWPPAGRGGKGGRVRARARGGRACAPMYKPRGTGGKQGSSKQGAAAAHPPWMCTISLMVAGCGGRLGWRCSVLKVL